MRNTGAKTTCLSGTGWNWLGVGVDLKTLPYPLQLVIIAFLKFSLVIPPPLEPCEGWNHPCRAPRFLTEG